MSVKIRLKRVGKTKAPSYRVVVADSRSPRDGRIIENIGWYNPLVEPSAIHIDEEKAFNGSMLVRSQPIRSLRYSNAQEHGSVMSRRNPPLLQLPKLSNV